MKSYFFLAFCQILTCLKIEVNQSPLIDWLVGCFGLNGHLRQYFSLYQVSVFQSISETVFQSILERGKKKKEMKDERKMSKQPPPAPTASTVDPCPTLIQICRTPRHWKFTQHHRTPTTPPLFERSWYYSNTRCHIFDDFKGFTISWHVGHLVMPSAPKGSKICLQLAQWLLIFFLIVKL